MQSRYYIAMLHLTLVLIVVSTFGRFDGKGEVFYYILNYYGNFLLFLLEPCLAALWLLYAHYQVFQKEKRTRKLYLPLAVLMGANAVLTIVSQYTGWLYYIDPENIYHRGPYFLLPYIFIAAPLLVGTLVMIVCNRERIENRYFYSLVFFSIPPAACAAAQCMVYGTELLLHGVTISLIVIFISIQNRSINIDYLTGAFSRKQLDMYLRKKIHQSSREKTFSAILIDLDNFKYINDTYGHDVGDDALETAVKIIRECVRSEDFVARFGGDEFCIVSDITDHVILKEAVNRIKGSVDNFNRHSDRPYKLGFSMGYSIYEYDSHMSAEEFKKQIDMYMYRNKNSRKVAGPVKSAG